MNLANLDIIAAEIDSQIPICSPFRSALRLIGVGAGSFWYFDLSESDLKFSVCCHTGCNPCSRSILPS